MKAIPGHKNYFANKKGDIFSNRIHPKYNKYGLLRKLNPTKMPTGYKAVTIYGKSQKAHRLILFTFVGPCPDRMEACHNDGIRDNNKLSNLRWDTPKNNHSDRKNHGTLLGGCKNPRAKLNTLQVRIIRKYPTYRGCLTHLAEYFNMSKTNISDIRAGKTWNTLINISKNF